METSIKMADEFASAMQQLSAEAQKSIPEINGHSESPLDIHAQLSQMSQEFRALNVRLNNVEAKVMQRLEDILPNAEPAGFAERFQKLDEQLDAIRSNEGMNQRLFDCLHEELIKYRDNFLHESLQKPFIRDLMTLFDDLNSIAAQLKTVGKSEAKRTTVTQARDNLDNAIHALVEILHRLEVTEIEAKDTVDLTIHRVVSFEPTEIAEEDGHIVMRLKRGFFWRDRVLRPEEVIAKRFN